MKAERVKAQRNAMIYLAKVNPKFKLAYDGTDLVLYERCYIFHGYSHFPVAKLQRDDIQPQGCAKFE